MPRPLISRLRRLLAVIAVLAALWTAVILVTGGFVLNFLDLQISSRNPRNPLWIALLSAIGAWSLPMPNRAQVTREVWVWSR
jgi:hypothetical protein